MQFGSEILIERTNALCNLKLRLLGSELVKIAKYLTIFLELNIVA